MLGMVAILLLGWLYSASQLYPAEDASILFRYSENLAQTGQISYNFQGEKAEGATDFLWMILIAGGVKLGLSSYALSLALSFMGLLLSLFL